MVKNYALHDVMCVSNIHYYTLQISVEKLQSSLNTTFRNTAGATDFEYYKEKGDRQDQDIKHSTPHWVKSFNTFRLSEDSRYIYTESQFDKYSNQDHVYKYETARDNLRNHRHQVYFSKSETAVPTILSKSDSLNVREQYGGKFSDDVMCAEKLMADAGEYIPAGEYVVSPNDNSSPGSAKFSPTPSVWSLAAPSSPCDDDWNFGCVSDLDNSAAEDEF